MVVKDETEVHKHHLGVGVCLNACVCVQVSYRILSFGRGNSKVWC